MAGRAQSRESLHRALRDVFETRGYEGATLSQLAEASGLSKASLYHHFPGGKNEMATVLLREAVADLERLAFSKLNSSRPAGDQLIRFVDGFAEYTNQGQQNCLVLVLSQGGAGGVLGETITQQYQDWLRRLTTTYEEAGNKPKKARRQATQLLAELYGHLTTARLLDNPGQFARHIKRLKKTTF